MNWEILLLVIYPEEMKNYMYLKTHWSHNKQDGEPISPNRQDMKSTYISKDVCMDKRNVHEDYIQLWKYYHL